MENWRAALFGLGIVLIGFGGYSSLEGIWKGVSLVAAGIALVLLGLSVERSRRPAKPEGSGADVAATMPAAEPAAPIVRTEAEPAAPIVRTEAEPAPEPEAVSESVTSPRSELAEEGEAPVRETVQPPAAPIEEGGEDEDEDEDELAHQHGLPMLGHSDLVSHIRDYHEGIPFDGSTIQLRLLHERAHA